MFTGKCRELIVLLFVVVYVNSFQTDENVDLVIDLLLNNAFGEDETPIEKPKEEDFSYKDGLWIYGSCVGIDQSRLIYEEEYDMHVDPKILQPVEAQVGLSVDNMKCIAVVGDSTAKVSRISGSLATLSVTLTVTNTDHFIVQIYS